MSPFNALGAQQKRDIVTYIADVTKINYTQSAVAINRTAQLNGTMAGPPPPSASSASGGGGALPAVTLGLLLLTTALRRRGWQRRPRSRPCA